MPELVEYKVVLSGKKLFMTWRMLRCQLGRDGGGSGKRHGQLRDACPKPVALLSAVDPTSNPPSHLPALVASRSPQSFRGEPGQPKTFTSSRSEKQPSDCPLGEPPPLQIDQLQDPFSSCLPAPVESSSARTTYIEQVALLKERKKEGNHQVGKSRFDG